MKRLTKKNKITLPRVVSPKARATAFITDRLDKFTSSAWSAEVYKMTPKEAAMILLERNCNKGIDATNRNLKPRNVRFLGSGYLRG